MQNSPIIQLLKSFNKSELRELLQFIQCKIFHTNGARSEMVIRLFQKLISPPPTSRVLTPNRDQLCRELFGDTTSDVQNFTRHISQAVDLVKKYLVYQYNLKNSHKNNQSLLHVFQKRELSRHFSQLKNRLQNRLNNNERKDSEDFFLHYVVAKNSLLMRQVRNRRLRTEHRDFSNAVYNLDLFFILNQLDFACQAMNRKQVINLPQVNFPLLDSIIESLPSSDYFNLPIVKMYWNTYKLLHTEESSYYNALKELLLEYFEDISSHHQINLFAFIKNYYIQKINKGENQYYFEYWEISILQLKKQPIITIGTYKNLVTTAVMIALQQEKPDFSEAINFIQKYTKKLPPDLQEEAQTYAEAYVAFYQKDFQVVKQKLSTNKEPQNTDSNENEKKPLTIIIYKFQDISYQIDARRLLVMTYFCLDEDNNFGKLHSNLSVFLSERRNDIPDLDLTKNRRFLAIIKKLFDLPLSKSERKTKLEKLKKEVEAAKLISDRTWLLKQIERKLS